MCTETHLYKQTLETVSIMHNTVCLHMNGLMNLVTNRTIYFDDIGVILNREFTYSLYHSENSETDVFCLK